MTTVKNFDAEIRELAAAAPALKAANEALIVARNAKREAEIEVLNRVLEAVRVALPMLVGRIESSRTQTRKQENGFSPRPQPVDVGGVSVVYAPMRGLSLGSSSTWGTIDDPSSHTHYYLMEDGSFARVVRTPYDENVQQFKTTWVPRGAYRVGYAQHIQSCTAYELLDRLTLEEIIHTLRTAMARQGDARAKSQAEIKESMNTVRGKEPK